MSEWLATLWSCDQIQNMHYFVWETYVKFVKPRFNCFKVERMKNNLGNAFIMSLMRFDSYGLRNGYDFNNNRILRKWTFSYPTKELPFFVKIEWYWGENAGWNPLVETAGFDYWIIKWYWMRQSQKWTKTRLISLS